jgi:hypothetical protein
MKHASKTTKKMTTPASTTPSSALPATKPGEATSPLIWRYSQLFNSWSGARGSVKLFIIHWDGVSGSSHPDGPWLLSCRLPPYKQDQDIPWRAKSVDDAKVMAVTLWDAWCARIGVKDAGPGV